MTLFPTMLDAIRLMKAGDLTSATAALQAGLSPRLSRNPDPTPTTDGNVIDLSPTRVTLPPTSDAGCSKAVPRRGVFSSERHGSTEYRLYIPADAAEGLPLVVMLHGCTQTPEDFATGTGMNALADELGFIVAYPRQPQSANPQKCWNWFRPGDQHRGRGEPAQIAGIVQDVVHESRADPARVYVAGLSAGGAAAAIMAMRYPDVFAAVGIHSGLACGSARDVPSAFAAMRRGGGMRDTAKVGVIVPVITFHGDRDPTVHPINSEEIVATAAAKSGTPLTSRTEYGSTTNGRKFERKMSTDGVGRILIEQWTIKGAGHAWSGGNALGSYTDPAGPDASRAMINFFLHHRLR